jgi:hypoxanthine phosphoribosyltransferase
MASFKDLPPLLYLGLYYPLNDRDGDCNYENPFFNKYSARILDLKQKDPDAIFYFTRELNNILDNEDITLTVIPSSRSTNSSSGIHDLARKLIRSKPKFVDGTLCLKRFKVIGSSSPTRSFNNRAIEKHLQTIEIQKLSLVRDKNIIVLDDVITTGNSINACKQLLLQAGAREVKSIILGKTSRCEPSISHDFIEWKLRQELDECYLGRDLEIDSLKKNYYDNEQWLELATLDEHEKIERDAEDEREYLDDDDYDALYELYQFRKQILQICMIVIRLARFAHGIEICSQQSENWYHTMGGYRFDR